MTPAISHARKWFPGLLLLLLLASCGGGSGGSTATPEQPREPVAGDWKTAAQRNSLAVAELDAAMRDAAASHAPVSLGAIYPVVAYRLTYYTTDVQGRLVLASGLVAVPQKGGLPSPVLSYQHGTTYQDAEVPGNNAVAAEPAILMASQGYIVLAADYLGYGETRGLPHPYLLAGPSASVVVDFMQAARRWMQASRIAYNGQLFLTGYSEGGYVTMAAHRSLQAGNPTGLTPVASVPAAGPYQLTDTLDELVRRQGVDPDYLQYLPAYLRKQLRDRLLREVLDSGTDIIFDTTFLDRYLAGDRDALERDSNVHDWKPVIPVRLHHGLDDEIVPYVSATSTLAAMQRRGVDVALVNCTASPSTHTGCIPSYLEFMLGYFNNLARDL